MIIALMTVVCVEVFKRYLLNAPTAWIFDLNNMLSALCSCLAAPIPGECLSYGDFLYSSMKPRTRRCSISHLYIVFFVPGIAALIYAGSYYAADSWRIDEHSNVTADGPPIYHFKTDYPDRRRIGDAAGDCRNHAVRRLSQDRRLAWPSQGCGRDRCGRGELAHSEYIDAAERKAAIERAQHV